MKKAALLSVTDKTGIVDFSKSLVELGFEILSTGGTARTLREASVPVTDISSYTDFPEIMDGRVKTLHPKVHGGILYDRSNKTHVEAKEGLGATDIQIVCVNLYAFVEEAVSKNLPIAEAIEFIDIGGPTLLRAAAKNHENVLPIMDPTDYSPVLQLLKSGPIPTEHPIRLKLATKTFQNIATYNRSIADYLAGESEQTLRYGENPHQTASLRVDEGPKVGFGAAEKIQGKELSYNNYLDMDAAYKLVCDFAEPAVTVVKHNNPCGVATHKSKSQLDIYKQALAGDPKSAFGGIVAFNTKLEERTASEMGSHFFECILAPDFSPEALAVLKKKKNLRVVKIPLVSQIPRREVRTICGAELWQDSDQQLVSEMKVVTKTQPSSQIMNDLKDAYTVAKHVKSNAIVLFHHGASVGIGAGQMSRIDACELAVKKASDVNFSTKGSVLASDAFFPFKDTVEFAAANGIKAIIQPGGSIRDEESIQCADEHGIAMVFTGMRHFRH